MNKAATDRGDLSRILTNLYQIWLVHEDYMLANEFTVSNSVNLIKQSPYSVHVINENLPEGIKGEIEAICWIE